MGFLDWIFGNSKANSNLKNNQFNISNSELINNNKIDNYQAISKPIFRDFIIPDNFTKSFNLADKSYFDVEELVNQYKSQNQTFLRIISEIKSSEYYSKNSQMPSHVASFEYKIKEEKEILESIGNKIKMIKATLNGIHNKLSDKNYSEIKYDSIITKEAVNLEFEIKKLIKCRENEVLTLKEFIIFIKYLKTKTEFLPLENNTKLNNNILQKDPGMHDYYKNTLEKLSNIGDYLFLNSFKIFYQTCTFMQTALIKLNEQLIEFQKEHRKYLEDKAKATIILKQEELLKNAA